MTRLCLIFLLLTACGPGQSELTTDPGTTASTTTAPETTADPTDTGDVPTSPLSSDTTPSTSTSDDTGISTESTTTDATTIGPSDTGESDTSPPGDEYVAFFFAGGLDHILIHKSDLKNDRCTTLHLARPTDGDPALAIDVPEMWGPQNAGIAVGLDGCLEGTPGDLGVAAIAGSGTITWQLAPNEFCPKIISLNLDLEFPQDEPWVPAKEHLETMDLAVQDCP
ncbi:MAG: hypothetical protein IPK80_19315 [Nannocystis sp.]|nr:hypothetical protein [Nannocystis sp.]